MSILPKVNHTWIKGHQVQESPATKKSYTTMLPAKTNEHDADNAAYNISHNWSFAKKFPKPQSPVSLPEISEFLREELNKSGGSACAISSSKVSLKQQHVAQEDDCANIDGETKSSEGNLFENLSCFSNSTKSGRVKLKRPIRELSEDVYLNTVITKKTKQENGRLLSNPSEQNLSATPIDPTIVGSSDGERIDDHSKLSNVEKSENNILTETFSNQNFQIAPGTVQNRHESSSFSSLMNNDFTLANPFCEITTLPQLDQEKMWYRNLTTVTNLTENVNSFSSENNLGNVVQASVPFHDNHHEITDEQLYETYLNKEVFPRRRLPWYSFESETIGKNTRAPVGYNQNKLGPATAPQENLSPTNNLNNLGQTNPLDLKEITWEDAKQHTPQLENGFLQLQASDTLLDDKYDLSDVDISCMEHIEREYHKEAVKEMELACSLLNIPTDAEEWTEHHVDKWIMWTVHQCFLPRFDISQLRMSGFELCKLSESDMRARVPTCGDILHARLRIWRSASKMQDAFESKDSTNNACKLIKKTVNYSNKTSLTTFGKADEIVEADDASSLMKSNQTSSIHLWVFLKELLLQPQIYGRFIRWIDQEKGVFKIEDSVEVARLWGVRKNRPAMNYDKLSRSIRQYYKKNIIKKTPISQRLVYQFVNPVQSMPVVHP